MADAKISFEVSQEIQQKLNDHLPWGLKRHVFTCLAERLVDLLDATTLDRNVVIGAIITGELILVPRSVIQNLNKGEDDGRT